MCRVKSFIFHFISHKYLDTINLLMGDSLYDIFASILFNLLVYCKLMSYAIYMERACDCFKQTMCTMALFDFLVVLEHRDITSYDCHFISAVDTYHHFLSLNVQYFKLRLYVPFHTVIIYFNFVSQMNHARFD